MGKRKTKNKHENECCRRMPWAGCPHALREEPERSKGARHAERTLEPRPVRQLQRHVGYAHKNPAGRYFVSLTCTEEKEPLPETDRAVGIDLGITDVVVTSDGFKSGNPKYLEDDLHRLRKAQRRLSRKKKGSQNWKKQKRRVARLHEKIADTGWSTLVQYIEYKAEWAGRTVVKIDRWFPSTKRCSACGHVGETKPLSVRHWQCEECGECHDRDVNAAKNICTAGLAGAADAANDSGEHSKTREAFVLSSHVPSKEYV